MSRLTANPFQRPPMFQFPHRAPTALQSPPDTDTIPPNLSMSTANASVAVGLDSLPEPHPYAAAPAPSADPPPRARKGPTLAYYNSGIREARERTVQRSFKSFIVVLPPPALIDEHGPLGHTLSTGPRHRLRDGILLPLFPTIFGQLSAIAREFNFPSTAGLCLYLHIHEHGITMAPRVSDDAWPLVWAHAFDAPAHSAGRLPIAGKVEFDIDFAHARWFRLWLTGGAHREQEIPFMMDMPPSTIEGPASPPKREHRHDRHESRTTSVGDQHSLAPTLSQAPALAQAPAPGTLSKRVSHIPRKLSLVDRYDFPTSQPQSRTPSRPTLSPTRELSPIMQEEEPQSALERKVRKWRARTSAVLPSPLGGGDDDDAIAEDAPAREARAAEEAADDADAVSELNLADYAWSVSSRGPADYDQEMPLSGARRAPSVHIAARAQGSVALTPTTATSWGALDLPSPAPPRSRAATPDIAMRHVDDAPPTPATATSWGAPAAWPASPAPQHAPSVDLAHRVMGSRPCTPATATSWGPGSYPASPAAAACPRSPSIHLALRGECSRPVTPRTATSWGAPSEWPASPPACAARVDTPDAAQVAFDFDGERGARRAPRSFPHCDAFETTPWNHVWPYHLPRALDEYPHNLYSLYPDADGQSSIQVAAPVDSPGARAVEPAHPSPVSAKNGPWTQVWPYTNAGFPAEDSVVEAASENDGDEGSEHGAPPSTPLSFPYYDAFTAAPWPHVWPYTQAYPGNLDNIYPPVSSPSPAPEPLARAVTIARESEGDEERDDDGALFEPKAAPFQGIMVPQDAEVCVEEEESASDDGAMLVPRPNPFQGIMVQQAVEVHEEISGARDAAAFGVPRPNPFQGIVIRQDVEVHEEDEFGMRDGDDLQDDDVDLQEDGDLDVHEDDADPEDDGDRLIARPNPYQGIMISVATEVHEDRGAHGVEEVVAKPMSFPYYDAFKAAPWGHVWPYTSAYPGNLADGIYPPVSSPPAYESACGLESAAPRGVTAQVGTAVDSSPAAGSAAEAEAADDGAAPEDEGPPSPMSFTSYDVRRGDAWARAPQHGEPFASMQIPTIRITPESDCEDEAPTPAVSPVADAFPPAPPRQAWPYTEAGAQGAAPARRTHAQLHAMVMLGHASQPQAAPARRTHAALHAVVIREAPVAARTLPPVSSAARYPCLS
ncbi:hypothetical protein HDZ31DRAFT_9595, partial [Schizophyllum fasciatum]